MNVMELKKVSLKFNGKKILNNLSVKFGKGNIHAVVGPNGAGKSTLASAIMGLEGYRNIEGEIFYNSENINNLSLDGRAKKGITLAWQEPARYEGLLIKDFIFAAAKDKSIKNLKEILLRVGLNSEEYIGRSVDKTLSGGERKKIELASILAMEPEFVMLDEPDSGIDIESLDRIFAAIKVLKKKGAAVILITHSLAVLKQADYACLLCHGSIIDEGETKKIIPYFENKCLICDHINEPGYGEK